MPARFQSSRLPGKPLLDIDGRPMIEHVYRRAAAVRSVSAVIVATDDERIASAVRAFGGDARLTRADHYSATDRLAEVAERLDCELVVNVQGDEPLIDPQAIDAAITPFEADPALEMSTLCRAIDDPAELADPHVVKVVMDRQGFALYFSRAPIPFDRRTVFPDGPANRGRQGSSGPRPAEAGVPAPQATAVAKAMAVRRSFARRRKAGAGRHQWRSALPAFKHLGLYVYRRSVLLALARLQPTPLEVAESLEQLRALEHGYRIRVVETTAESIGVDTPEDLERVRRIVTGVTRV
ncbi:MAG: 3-deoxy-manno-octulosonate cytidylyltransferase [Acidobacteria bacterium]|nr:3-deoxy-manno-octulosonate cytidylyltransferase [Acidobacteriota bacterium]